MNATCAHVAGYWPASEQPTAYGVCMCESGGDPSAHCLNCAGVPEDSRGAMQVNVGPGAHPQYAARNLYDPDVNAQTALGIWQGSGWGAWSTYTNGCFRQYVSDFTGGPVATPVLAGLGKKGLIYLGIAAVVVALLA